jgi:hypothetical protein
MLGQDLQRRNNLLQLAGPVALTSAGNCAVVWDTACGRRTLLACADGGGVGALAVHPSGGLFAVGGKARTASPTITLYSYPQLEVGAGAAATEAPAGTRLLCRPCLGSPLRT